MVERTLKLYDCDVCGSEGERYSVTFPDGQLTLDRCERHNGHLEKLRNEKGTWVAKAPGSRSSFKVSSVDDIAKQKKSPK